MSWFVPVVTLVGMIFSAGITWGILTYRQHRSEETTGSLVKDLKECVDKLQDVVTEVKIVQVTGAKVESKVEEHDRRIVQLEIATAECIKRQHRRR